MSSDVSQALTEWIAGIAGQTGQRFCTQYELEYAPTGCRPDALMKWRPESSPDYFGPDALKHLPRFVVEILKIAEDHTDNFGQGRRRFVLRSTSLLGERSIKSFALLPSAEASSTALVQSGGSGSEFGETEPGLSGSPLVQAMGIVVQQNRQLMGHLENRDRQFSQMLQGTIGAINTITQNVIEDNKALRAALAEGGRVAAENMRLVEEAHSRAHERELEAHVTTAEQERKTLLVKEATNLMPVVVSQAMKRFGAAKKDPDASASGKAKTPKANADLAEAVAQFLESVGDEQRAQLLTILSPSQQILFGEIWDTVADADADTILLPRMLANLVTALQPNLARVFAILTDPQKAQFAKLHALAVAASASPAKSPSPSSPSPSSQESTPP